MPFSSASPDTETPRSQRRFRKLRGFAEVKLLLKALENRAPAELIDAARKVA